MKIIQTKDGVVVDIINARNDITLDTIAIVDSIPMFKPRDGFSGVLKYDIENGVYWEYVANPTDDEQEISSSELARMVEEVL